MQNKIDDFGIAHLTGFEQTVFDSRIIIAADDIITAKLFGIYFEYFTVHQRYFGQKIASLMVIDVIHTQRQR